MESRLLSVIVDSKHSLDVVAQCQSVMVDLQGLVKWLCWFEIWSALSKKSSHFRSDTSECSQFYHGSRFCNAVVWNKIENISPQKMKNLYSNQRIRQSMVLFPAKMVRFPAKMWANTVLTESSPELSQGGLIWGHSVTSRLTHKTTHAVRLLWVFC